MSVLEIQGPVEINDTVPAIISQDVDIISIDDGNSKKWELTINFGTQASVSQVIAIEESAAVTWSIYGIVRRGAKIDYTVDITSDGTDITFSITNNELSEIDVTLIRFS